MIPAMAPDKDAISRGENYLTKATVKNFVISGSICLIVFEKAKSDFISRFFSE
jgi:hypothetical protein